MEYLHFIINHSDTRILINLFILKHIEMVLKSQNKRGRTIPSPFLLTGRVQWLWSFHNTFQGPFHDQAPIM